MNKLTLHTRFLRFWRRYISPPTARCHVCEAPVIMLPSGRNVCENGRCLRVAEVHHSISYRPPTRSESHV